MASNSRAATIQSIATVSVRCHFVVCTRRTREVSFPLLIRTHGKNSVSLQQRNPTSVNAKRKMNRLGLKGESAPSVNAKRGYAC